MVLFLLLFGEDASYNFIIKTLLMAMRDFALSYYNKDSHGN